MKKSSALILALLFFVAGSGLTMLVAKTSVSTQNGAAAAVLAGSTDKVQKLITWTSHYTILENGMCNSYVDIWYYDPSAGSVVGSGGSYMYQSLPLQAGQTSCPKYNYIVGGFSKIQPKLLTVDQVIKAHSLYELQQSKYVPTLDQIKAAITANTAAKQ